MKGQNSSRNKYSKKPSFIKTQFDIEKQQTTESSVFQFHKTTNINDAGLILAMSVCPFSYTVTGKDQSFRVQQYCCLKSKQNIEKVQKQPSRGVLKKRCSENMQQIFKKGVLKISSKFTGKHPCQSLVSMQLLRNFIEITLRHGCCPVKLLHIFRTPFLKNTSDRLLLKVINPFHPSVYRNQSFDLHYKSSYLFLLYELQHQSGIG